MIALWRRLFALETLSPSGGKVSLPEKIKEGDKLVVNVELFVDARCPCGSTHIHRLTLYNTSECARCGRTIGVRAIEYIRAAPSCRPEPYVSVGYVQTDDSLVRRTTQGVH